MSKYGLILPNKQKGGKMIKADEKVVIEGNKKERFTNFEFLKTEVEVLRDTVDKIVEILIYNGLHREEKVEPEHFDYDEVFKRLE